MKRFHLFLGSSFKILVELIHNEFELKPRKEVQRGLQTFTMKRGVKPGWQVGLAGLREAHRPAPVPNFVGVGYFNDYEKDSASAWNTIVALPLEKSIPGYRIHREGVCTST